MTPAELREIVTLWGGPEKFAKVMHVQPRTVYNWLNGTHRIRGPVKELIKLLGKEQKDDRL